MDSDAAFKWILRELNASLRPFNFKRNGQTFSREFSQCWQVVNVQLSSFSAPGEKTLTVNFGVCSKSTLRFRDKDSSKPPLHYACPIRFRIGWLKEGKDVWWAIRDESSARVARNEVLAVVQGKGVPFLDTLASVNEILNLYDTGLVLGFEIDRDEDRLLLLAETGAAERARTRLDEYASRWPLTPAAERAAKFLGRFKETYFSAICTTDS